MHQLSCTFALFPSSLRHRHGASILGINWQTDGKCPGRCLSMSYSPAQVGSSNSASYWYLIVQLVQVIEAVWQSGSLSVAHRKAGSTTGSAGAAGHPSEVVLKWPELVVGFPPPQKKWPCFEQTSWRCKLIGQFLNFVTNKGFPVSRVRIDCKPGLARFFCGPTTNKAYTAR